MKARQKSQRHVFGALGLPAAAGGGFGCALGGAIDVWRDKAAGVGGSESPGLNNGDGLASAWLWAASS